MAKNLYVRLSERSKLILKSVVESYLETGDPAGSKTILKKIGINISSSSIRSILANLQKEGLLYAPHVSAGRLPTDKGMRLFVDGLLEFGRLSKNEQQNIKNQCQSSGKSYQKVLEEASKIELPFYIFHGTGDQLVSSDGSTEIYEKISSQKKSIHLFEGLYHETFNEKEGDRQQVCDALVSWVSTH